MCSRWSVGLCESRMNVHFPESPLKYGLCGLFSFLAGVCICCLHTGAQVALHTGVRLYAHGCAGPRVCTKKPDGCSRQVVVFICPVARSKAPLQVSEPWGRFHRPDSFQDPGSLRCSEGACCPSAALGKSDRTWAGWRSVDPPEAA